MNGRPDHHPARQGMAGGLGPWLNRISVGVALPRGQSEGSMQAVSEGG